MAPLRAGAGVDAPATSEAGSIHRLTQERLTAVGRQNTVMGAVALALASKLDEPGLDTGSSVAAVARQFQASLDKALEGVSDRADPLDEILARKKQRSA